MKGRNFRDEDEPCDFSFVTEVDMNFHSEGGVGGGERFMTVDQCNMGIPFRDGTPLKIFRATSQKRDRTPAFNGTKPAMISHSYRKYSSRPPNNGHSICAVRHLRMWKSGIPFTLCARVITVINSLRLTNSRLCVASVFFFPL